VNSQTIRKYTRILITLAALGIVLGVMGVIFGQGVLIKSVLALTAVAVTISFALFALAVHRTPPSD
jgi:sulfite exporter TauE/SafE